MTEMTEAKKVIAKVADEHTHSIDFDFCYCGMAFFAGDGITGQGAQAWSNHLAAEIDKALGGLTHQVVGVATDAQGHTYRTHRDDPNASVAESRWVSGWSEAQS